MKKKKCSLGNISFRIRLHMVRIVLKSISLGLKLL